MLFRERFCTYTVRARRVRIMRRPFMFRTISFSSVLLDWWDCRTLQTLQGTRNVG